MSEKTAEEKLREELEGKLSSVPQKKDAGKSEHVRKPIKPRAVRSRSAAKKTEKLANVGQRLDSFMEDFERRVAESLSAGKVFSTGRTWDERKTAEDISAELGLMRSEKDTVDPTPTPEPELPTPTPTPTPEPTPTPTPAQDDDSLDDIPVEIVNETEQEIEQELDDAFPDIPVIDAQDIAETSDAPDDNTLPDIPVIAPEPEEIDDAFENTSPSQENSTDFPAIADVVVNVDANLPQIASEQQESPSDDVAGEFPDPEGQAAPVTVTMPETTKTAEDKLMANIAEAMTGSPLTLDKPDPSEPYRLPENLLNQQNDPNTSPQSAEAKLIADISQAISESPIETAQNQANQNFEDELSPFDEMPLPEPIQTPDFDDSYEQDESVNDEDVDDEEGEGDDFDEPFLPDFPAETEQQEHSQDETLGEDFSYLPVAEDEAVDVDDNPVAEDEAVDVDDNPVAVDDTAVIDDNPVAVDEAVDVDDNPIAEDEAVDVDDNPVAMDEAVDVDDNPVADDMSNFSLLDEPVPAPAPDPDPEPITAEERLAQELADLTKPEQSLLDEPDDAGDDFNFMDTWGDAASAVNYGDEEPDPQPDPEPQPEPSHAEPEPPQPEPAPIISHDTLNFAAPKNPPAIETSHTEASVPQASPVWRIVLQSVLGLLILAGLFMLFRLHQLTDAITATMLYGSPQGKGYAQSYVYAVDRIADAEISSRMRLRGIEGWKLVGSRRTQDAATGHYGYEFIFMRPTPANP